MMPDYDAIEARLAAATPGPWEWDGDNILRRDMEDSVPFFYRVVAGMWAWEDGGIQYPGDADLFFNAPTDLRALLTRARALEAVVTAVKNKYRTRSTFVMDELDHALAALDAATDIASVRP